MRTLLVTCLIAGAALVGCATPPTTQTSHATKAQQELTVLYFDGCPNTPRMIQAVKEAAKRLGPAWTVRLVDLEDLPEQDIRRGYGSPSVLLDGRDLFGAPLPDSPSLACRTYVGGAPSTDSLVDAVRRRTSRDDNSP